MKGSSFDTFSVSRRTLLLVVEPFDPQKPLPTSVQFLTCTKPASIGDYFAPIAKK